jgi:hypothetical protein
MTRISRRRTMRDSLLGLGAVALHDLVIPHVRGVSAAILPGLKSGDHYRELALSAGKDTAGISASTLYRFLKQRGLSERQPFAPAAHKKFEAEHSYQIWQSDMLYGPYVQRLGRGKLQALLHAILDDASRHIPHAQFYTSQGLDACLDCLRQAIRR